MSSRDDPHRTLRGVVPERRNSFLQREQARLRLRRESPFSQDSDRRRRLSHKPFFAATRAGERARLMRQFDSKVAECRRMRTKMVPRADLLVNASQ